MGIITDFLTPEYIREKMELERVLLEGSWKLWPPDPTKEQHDLFSLRQTRHLMNIAALEYAAGAAADDVRRLYREAAAIWEPVIASVDFSPRVYEGVTSSPNEAKSFVSDYGADVEKRGADYRYRYIAVPEPFLTEFCHTLQAAAISGDLALAQRLAEAYKTRRVTRGSFTVLRHLLAGNDPAAAHAANELQPAYGSDWPPALIEFPQGVVSADPGLLVKGIKTLTTRMKGMWQEKKWRTRHEKLKADEIARFRGKPVPAWPEKVRDVRNHLVGMRWILSEHALAFLNVAAWRGMASPFDQPKLFSEWVPLSLACFD